MSTNSDKNKARMLHSGVLITIVLLFLLYISGVFAMPMMEPDEGRYNLVASEMVQSGDYIVPQLNGVPYLVKPPLQHWLTSLSFQVVGKDYRAGRLFPTLFSLLTVLILFLFIRKEIDLKAGLFFVLIALSSLFTIGVYWINILDQGAAFFVTAALLSFFMYYKDGKARWIYCFWIACGLGILQKGLIGFVLPFGVIVLFSLWKRSPSYLLKLFRPLPLMVFSAIVLPWFVLIEIEKPGALWLLIVREHFERYTSTIHHHREPFYFLSLVALAGLLPWTGWLIRKWKRNEIASSSKEVLVFFICWSGGILLFFSLSSSQLVSYLTPVVPALCAIIAILLAGRERKSFRAGFFTSALMLLFVSVIIVYSIQNDIPCKWGLVIPISLLVVLAGISGRRMDQHKCILLTALLFSASIFALLFLAAPKFEDNRSTQRCAHLIAENFGNDVVVCRYSEQLPGLGFELGKRLVTLGSPGEIESGFSWITENERRLWFPTRREFQEIYGKGNVLIVLRDKKQAQFEKDYGHWKQIARVGRFLIMQENPAKKGTSTLLVP